MAVHTDGALGLRAAQPHRTVVVGCGDGCYAIAGFELMTAVVNNLPVTPFSTANRHRSQDHPLGDPTLQQFPEGDPAMEWETLEERLRGSN